MTAPCSPNDLPSKQPLPRVAIGVIALLAGLLFVSQAGAQSGDRFTVPLSRNNKPTFTKQTGLQITVDTTWAGNRGYRPVTVTASMATAATADTQLTIRFYAGTWRSHQAISVEHDFELPQGSASVTSTFSVPQYVDWNSFSWDIWVDGVEDDYLKLTPTGFNSGSNSTVAVGRFDLGTASQLNRGGTSLVQAATSGAVGEQILNLNNLPESWIDYSPLDVVTTTVDALELARVSSPEKLTALLRWVRAGGNLWVLGVGEDFAALPELNQVLAIESSDEAADESDWRFLKLSSTGRTRLNDVTDLMMDSRSSSQVLSRSELTDSKFADVAVDSRRWFVARQFGLGTILALENDESLRIGQNAPLATALQRSAVTENIIWSTRHGNDPATGNPNFNNWLIADVGAAPVFEFQLLISLFVIGIGPVNYWLLKRRNQLPLLLLTVPIAALAATLMLFAYGFLADGIETRLRARSYTILDQQAGEVATWSRMSYYAGIAPSDGLVVPGDTTVYPMLPSRSEYTAFGRRQVNQQRSLEWTDEQLLTRGWLGSRTPTQYLTITARPSAKRLDFQTVADGLQVRNQLGTSVAMLIAQDADGNIFLGEGIDAEGQAKLKAANYLEAASLLRRLMTENLPQLPPGYVENNRGRRRRDYGNPFSESLMELQLEAISSPQATGWGNRTFIAVTADGIELPQGLDDLEENNSFHVVRGTW